MCLFIAGTIAGLLSRDGADVDLNSRKVRGDYTPQMYQVIKGERYLITVTYAGAAELVGHEVFRGRERPGDLSSPELTGWQCDRCTLVFDAPAEHDCRPQIPAGRPGPRGAEVDEAPHDFCRCSHSDHPAGRGRPRTCSDGGRHHDRDAWIPLAMGYELRKQSIRSDARAICDLCIAAGHTNGAYHEPPTVLAPPDSGQVDGSDHGA